MKPIAMSTLRSTVETITPDRADALLHTSAGNRSISKHLVRFLASEMSSGSWMLNGEPIIISITGKLIEGHHRMHACITSGRPFVTAVTYGVDDGAFVTINTGRTRSPGDVFKIIGIPNSNKMSSVVNKSIYYMHSVGKDSVNEWNVPFTMSKNKLVEVYHADAERYIDANAHAYRIYDALPSSIPSVVGGMHYLFSTVNPILAADFAEKVRSGANLPEGHPAMALRNAWIKRREAKRRSSSSEMMVITCHAWNAFRHGRSVKLLRHNVDHPVPDYR